MKKDPAASLNSTVDHLRSCIIEMRAAAKAEQIDPDGPLGVWVRAQEVMLLGMADFAEQQTDQIVERVSAVERSMKSALTLVEAEVAKLIATREEARQQTIKMREEGLLLKEERLQAGDDMAIRLSDKIQNCLKTTMLVRERRWNLRQNVRLVSLGAAVLLAVFLSGQWMQGHNRAAAIIERCRTNLATDPDTKVSYCAMSTIEGVPGPAPSQAAAGEKRERAHEANYVGSGVLRCLDRMCKPAATWRDAGRDRERHHQHAVGAGGVPGGGERVADLFWTEPASLPARLHRSAGRLDEPDLAGVHAHPVPARSAGLGAF
jgi:hypothetical protein